MNWVEMWSLHRSGWRWWHTAFQLVVKIRIVSQFSIWSVCSDGEIIQQFNYENFPYHPTNKRKLWKSSLHAIHHGRCGPHQWQQTKLTTIDIRNMCTHVGGLIKEPTQFSAHPPCYHYHHHCDCNLLISMHVGERKKKKKRVNSFAH